MKERKIPESVKVAMRAKMEEAIRMYEEGHPLWIICPGSFTSTSQPGFRFSVTLREEL